MRKTGGLVLGAALLVGGCTCFAQNAPIEFARMERNTLLPPKPAAPASKASASLYSGFKPANSSSSAPAEAGASSVAEAMRILYAGQRRPLGAKFFLLNGLHLGMAGLDLALTQRCIDAHRCREGNPLMPSSLAGRASLQFSLVGFGAFVSGRLKRHGSKLWWVTPFVGIVAHGAGVASGFLNQP